MKKEKPLTDFKRKAKISKKESYKF